MNLSLNWLKDFVEIPKSIKAEEIARALTMHTVEVENILEQASQFKNFVVGEILEVSKHPNADRLSLTKVNIGKEVLDIVCGAPNIARGQKVPVSLVGAILPNGLEIKEAEVRGVISRGMICAPDELGVGSDHSGIMVLDSKAKIGQKFSDYLSYDDIIIEVDNKSLSNRPDLWGLIGMAREISAIKNLKFSPTGKQDKKYKSRKEIFRSDKKLKKLSIKIEKHQDCPRYMAISIKGIKIEESPSWMQERLVAVGLKPINNIVDITNYVMIELGQPMHAFDAAKIDKINIRRARKGETMKTLDGAERKLNDGMIIIADSKKPIALAGVMGGMDSEITDNTEEVIFESANFDYISIRKTSTSLSLRTDSSSRFEKGLDPNNCERALARAIELTKQIIPSAEISSELFDDARFKLNLGPIDLSVDWVEKYLGIKIEEEQIVRILTALGFKVEKKKDLLSVVIPTWRATKDISTKEDILEEIARVYGYDNIPSMMPSTVMTYPAKNKELEFIRKARSILRGLSFSEVYNYSFVDEGQLKKMGIDTSDYVRLANPLSKNQTLLRQKMSTNMLLNVKLNQARYDEFSIFEIGSVFFDYEGSFNKNKHDNEKIPYQENRLGLLFAVEKSDDFFRKAKGIIESFFKYFDLPLAFCEIDKDFPWAEKLFQGNIFVANTKGEKENTLLGKIAKLDDKIAKSIGIKKEVIVVELSLNEILKSISLLGEKKYKALPKYPALLRDLAFVVDKKVSYRDIIRTIYSHNNYIEEVKLFDVYSGESIGKDNKNLAFRVKYQAEKTLTAEEVDTIQKGLLEKLENDYQAKIRNF